MTKTFFSRQGAEKFAKLLASAGYESKIWIGTDGFKQTVYIVKWQENA